MNLQLGKSVSLGYGEVRWPSRGDFAALEFIFLDTMIPAVGASVKRLSTRGPGAVHRGPLYLQVNRGDLMPRGEGESGNQSHEAMLRRSTERCYLAAKSPASWWVNQRPQRSTECRHAAKSLATAGGSLPILFVVCQSAAIN